MGPVAIDFRLILLTTLLLTETLTRESFLGATLFSGLHVVAVLLDFLDDIFRLHFPLEAPECILQRFTLLNDNFCHAYSPPSLLVCEFVLLVSHQCNRTTPCPAISNFYPRLPSKSRDKLYKATVGALCNYIVNGYLDRKYLLTWSGSALAESSGDISARSEFLAVECAFGRSGSRRFSPEPFKDFAECP